MGHGHGHGHASSDVDPEAHRKPLEAGCGVGQILFLDAQSGIAGDMTIAALVDLGVPFSVVEEAVGALGSGGYRLELRSQSIGSLGASKFDVVLDGQAETRHYTQIDELIAGAALETPVADAARKIFLRLGEAEASAHRIDIEQVHFHEVGAVDAIVDIVGAAACLNHLGAELWTSPMPIGHGSVKCQHGQLPLPAPATLACLRGVPTVEAGIEAELVTPTGAAIVGAMASGFARWPDGLVASHIGWGRGTREFPDRLNALRAVLGSRQTRVKTSDYVLGECNVDDMTGELAAFSIEQLMAGAAVDAWATPITMKKGRPALTLSALCRASDSDGVARVMLRETSTIGVRVIDAGRYERPRKIISVDTEYGTVPVKVSGGDYGPPQIKAEFDVCAQLAQNSGVPVRLIVEAAAAAARAKLDKSSD